MKDLVQIDIETAIVLYSKGYKHIPIMQGDPFSEDWTSKQPLYLDDLLESLVIFASDSKREQLLNPPKPDIKTMKEDIALHYEPHFRIDPEEDEEDDDPDWVETEPEPIEIIPDDDEVPERERIEYQKPEVVTVEQVTKMAEKTDTKTEKQKANALATEIQLGKKEPLSWNVRDAIRMHDKDSVSYGTLATIYGIKSPQTVINRINQYKMK